MNAKIKSRLNVTMF